MIISFNFSSFDICKICFVLTLEVVVAIVAVVHLPSAGEPALALPHVTLALALFDDGHPPVDAQQRRETDAPLNGKHDQVNPTENQKPQKTVLALDTGKLNVIAAALGALLIVKHNDNLLF